MAKLRIPPSNLPGLKYLSLLSDDEINIVYEVLRKLPEGVTFKEFKKSLTEYLKVDNINSIASAIYSIGSLLIYQDVSIEKLPSEIVDAYEEQQEEDDLKLLDRNKLEERIKYIILNLDSIKVTFKGIALITNSNKKIVRAIDIFSDVNLILDDDFKSKNGLIIHNMKIEFDFEDKDRTHHFIMDSADLKKLKAQIEAALLKEENIKINNQGLINFIDITG